MLTRIYRAKANGRLQADLRGGAFQTARIDGVGLPMIGDAGRWLYEFIRQEDDSAIPGTPESNPLPVPLGLSVGTLTATSAVLDWDQVGGFDPDADNYLIQTSIDQGVTWTSVSSAEGGEPDTNLTTITTLTADTAYQARVAYVKGGTVTGDFSRPVSFQTPSV